MFLEVNFFAETLNLQTQMNVILPQRVGWWRDLPKGDGTCPVLYLLHGMSDDHTAWCRRTSIERYAEEKNIAVIMPAGDLGWYTDMKYGYAYYTFLTEELPVICHNFFPMLSTEREKTYIGGLSMGGYGALKFALNKADRYAYAGVFSGAVDAYEEIRKETYPPEELALYNDIFGTDEEFLGSINDLPAMVKKHASDEVKTKIYMSIGLSDWLLPMNRRVSALLSENGYDVTYSEVPGDHEWAVWDSEVRKFLAWLPERRDS